MLMKIICEKNDIKKRKFNTRIAGIKKVLFNQYLIVGRKSVVVNKSVINILWKISFKKRLQENLLIISGFFDKFKLKI